MTAVGAKTLSLLSEIRDLQELLWGLPADYRGGVFARVYEQRLERLQRELELMSKETP